MPVTIETCPPRQMLAQFLAGMLNADDAGRIERHLSTCSNCVDACTSLNPNDEISSVLPSLARQSDSLESLPPQLLNRLISMTGTARLSSASTISEAGDNDCDCEVEQFLGALPSDDDGCRILGGYRIDGVLGVGGMGIVLDGRDQKLGREVAIKVIRPSVALRQVSLTRFLREGRLAASLDHPNIVRVLHVDEDGGVPFLVMEKIEGESLKSCLAVRQTLSVEDVLATGRQIAAGLAAAHDRGMCHRDIKPENILLDEDGGQARLVDFGLARVIDENMHLTGSGTMLGTPCYLSPEQVDGHRVDHRSDLFSLGSVLFEMVTGVSPFRRSTLLATVAALASDTPDPSHEINPDVPLELSALICRLLKRNPDERIQSAAELETLLKAIAENDKALTCSLRTDFDDPSAIRKSRRRAAVAIGVLAAGVLGAIVIAASLPGKATAPGRNHETAATIPAEHDGTTASSDTLSRPLSTVVTDSDAAASASPVGVSTNVFDSGPNSPLTPMTLVAAPARLDGIDAWTIDGAFHRAEVTDFDFSPDGRFLATGGYDGTLRIWDAATFELRRIFASHAREIVQVAWAPRGPFVVSISTDERAHVWNVDTGELVGDQEMERPRLDERTHWSSTGVLAVPVHRLATRSVAYWYWNVPGITTTDTMFPRGAFGDYGRHCRWLPGGTSYLQQRGSHELVEVDIATDNPLNTIDVPLGATWEVLPDGNLLIARNDEVETLQITPKTVTGQFRTDGLPVDSLHVSHDGQFVAVCCGERSVLKIVDLSAGREIRDVRLSHGEAFSRRIRWMTDSQRVVWTASGDVQQPALQVLDVITGEASAHRIQCDRVTGSDGIAACVSAFTGAVWSPLDDELVTSGTGGLQLWNLTTGASTTIPLPSDDLTLLSYQRPLARLVSERGVHSVNVVTGEWSLQATGKTVAATPNGRITLLSQSDNTLVLHEPLTGDSYPFPGTLEFEPLLAALSPDGSRLIAIRPETLDAHITDLADGQRIQTIDLRESFPGSRIERTASYDDVVWSPDAKLFAARLTDRRNSIIQIWDSDTGKMFRYLDGTQLAGSMVWLNDGRLLLGTQQPREAVSKYAGPWQPLLIWDSQNNWAHTEWNIDGQWIGPIIPSADDTLLAVLTGRTGPRFDQTSVVRLLDARNGRPVATLAQLAGADGELIPISIPAAGSALTAPSVLANDEAFAIIRRGSVQESMPWKRFIETYAGLQGKDSTDP